MHLFHLVYVCIYRYLLLSTFLERGPGKRKIPISFFTSHIDELNLDNFVSELVRVSEGWTGADLTNVVRRVRWCAEDSAHAHITHEDVNEAVKGVCVHVVVGSLSLFVL